MSRQNIDPEELHSDAKLNDALALIHSSPSASISIREKFRLDTEVESEGSNSSAGERQLREFGWGCYSMTSFAVTDGQSR
jgi:ABC-type multidrug transport system fused ATPase/permease subunit